MGNPCISESQEGKSLWYKQRVLKFIMEPFKSRLANFTLMKLADCGFLPPIFADLKVRTRNRRSADILARIANSVQKFQWVIELACRWQSSFYAGRYVAVMLPLIFGFRHSVHRKLGNTSQIVDLVAQRFSMKPISISAKTENFG